MSPAGVLKPTKRYAVRCVAAWDRFWFTPRTPHLLAVLRIIAGTMLLYSHAVLASDLESFLGPNAWINSTVAAGIHDGTLGGPDAGWSYLWHLKSGTALALHHLFTMAVTAMFVIGLGTRVTGPLAWFLQLMLIHRLTGALFGFDQIVTYAVMYLMLAPTGAVFSVDALLRRRLAVRVESSRLLTWWLPNPEPDVASNVATRLFQIHLCVIYLFGGLAKARGVSWWDGTAVWYAIGNHEYQSFDMTWMAAWPGLFSALSHLTMLWEIFYIVLIWPRLTRPITLMIAVAVHGGIALFLGMMTFGIMMMVANLIFLPHRWFTPQPDEDSERDLAGKSSEQQEQELAEGWDALQRRKEKLRAKESVYRERVERLKRREGKLKDLVERNRRRKRRDHDSADTADVDDADTDDHEIDDDDLIDEHDDT